MRSLAPGPWPLAIFPNVVHSWLPWLLCPGGLRAAERFKPAPDRIKTSFGQLLIKKDGRFVMKDSSGKIVASATSPPKVRAC